MRVFLLNVLKKLRKEINRLLNKEMSNLYLKVTVEEENWRFQNFDFLGLKNLSPCQFWGAPTQEVSLNFKTSCWNLKIRGLEVKLCVAFILFSFWKELWRSRVKESMHFDEQKYKLELNGIKNGKSHISFIETNLVLQLI